MITSLKSCRHETDLQAALLLGQGDDVIALHTPDGRFVDVSEGASAFFGHDAANLVDKRLMDVIAPAHQRRLLAGLAKLSKPSGTGTARFDCRTAITGRMVEITLTRHKRGMRSVTRDVEVRMAREADVVARARAIVDETARRSEQLANVSHEIRTPLNAVIGFAEAIHGEQFGPLSNDKYRDYARIIHDSGEHLLTLISDILDLSRAEANETALQLAPASLADVIQLCTDIMALRISEASLQLEVDISAGLENVLIDVKIVRQVVINLLSNALKFTEEGGIHVIARPDGQWIELSVIDTGVGMSPDDLSRVGTRFHQARTEGVRGARGTGIGLSLSKALARVHGGDLTLVSAIGEGTRATLRLPLRHPGHRPDQDRSQVRERPLALVAP